jgi:hypothetical protein
VCPAPPCGSMPPQVLCADGHRAAVLQEREGCGPQPPWRGGCAGGWGAAVVQRLHKPHPVGSSLSRPARAACPPFFSHCSQMHNTNVQLCSVERSTLNRLYTNGAASAQRLTGCWVCGNVGLVTYEAVVGGPGI